MTDYPTGRTLAKDRLYDLMRHILAKTIGVREFCFQFERIYSLELETSEVSESEMEALKKVFDVVVWYSPYEKEREVYPGYVADERVITVVRDVATVVGL